jgi:hypothetical protein
VVKTPTLSFDTRKSHNGGKYNTTVDKNVIKTCCYIQISTCPYTVCFLTCPYTGSVFLSTSGRACRLALRPLGWSSLFTSETWNEDERNFHGAIPLLANLALLPPIGGTPTGLQRGSALGTAKQKAPVRAEPHPPRSFALLSAPGPSRSCSGSLSCSIFDRIGDLVKRDGKMESKSTRKLGVAGCEKAPGKRSG